MHPAPQWERVGELPQMDQVFDANFEFKACPANPCARGFSPMCSGCDLVRACVCVLQVKPKAQQSSGLLAPKKGNGDWVMKTPERRRFCLRQGLAQRYWFSQNVGKLPFKSKALAASVCSAHPSSS